jgi:nitrate reductase alpha subunit
MAMLFGPFGDVYRDDPRMPWAGEAYAELNPEDAKDLGILDGDYIWIDADPADRPYRGAKPDDPFYDVARVMMRTRVFPGMPKGTIRTWFNMYAATKGTVAAKRSDPDGPAQNPETGYPALFRHGSHQSATKAWLRPTQMTDTMPRKSYFGHQLGVGFEADVHSPSGAPKESFVRVVRAESGDLDGRRWHPLRTGLRPQAPSKRLRAYIAGRYVTTRKRS